MKSRFIIALENELLLANSLIDLKRLNIEAISIGGGTPLELSVLHLSTLLAILKRYLNVRVAPAIEYSIEINPYDAIRLQTFLEKLELLRTFNVNRLSFGVQSLDDQVLKANGSRHTAADVTECVGIARECGFRNVNVDLIFGLAKQSLRSWEDTLCRICKLHPEHVSLFALKSISDKSLLQHSESLNGRNRESWVNIAQRFLGNEGYTEYFPRAFACSKEFAYKYEVNTFVFRKAVLGFGPGSITWAGQFCYRNVRDLTRYEELLKSCILPIDADTIHYPCDNFLSRLAYFGGTT